MSVRCKFRCLSFTHHAEPSITGTEVRMLPVIPKCASYPDGCEENKSFWDATPSGECKITFAQGAEIPFLLGRSYYIDMDPSSEEGSWKLWEVRQHPNDLGIRLGLGWRHDQEMMSAELEMSTGNEAAWRHFLDQVGTKWRVTFTEAPVTPEPEPSLS